MDEWEIKRWARIRDRGRMRFVWLVALPVAALLFTVLTAFDLVFASARNFAPRYTVGAFVRSLGAAIGVLVVFWRTRNNLWERQERAYLEAMRPSPGDETSTDWKM